MSRTCIKDFFVVWDKQKISSNDCTPSKSNDREKCWKRINWQTTSETLILHTKRLLQTVFARGGALKQYTQRISTFQATKLIWIIPKIWANQPENLEQPWKCSTLFIELSGTKHDAYNVVDTRERSGKTTIIPTDKKERPRNRKTIKAHNGPLSQKNIIFQWCLWLLAREPSPIKSSCWKIRKTTGTETYKDPIYTQAQHSIIPVLP